VRLARYLLENKSDDNTVEASHKVLAFELGTAREVVSRHLKDFETNGWVSLSRKNIELIKTHEMGKLVAGLV
jgi:CRP/FNR family transcriptional regulator